MSYRFSKTEKWQDKWFRKLPVDAKLLFLYLLDNCDLAGFFEIDEEIITFFTGIEDVSKTLNKLNSKNIIIKDNWLWIKNFIIHQKNFPLNPENNAHKHIIGLFNQKQDKFGVDFRGYLGANKGDTRGPGKGNSKGIGKGKGKESPENEKFKPLFDYYNSLNIVKHNELTKEIVDGIKYCIDKRTTTVENIKLSLKNYAVVINDADYFFNTRWGLNKFCRQGNAYTDFLNDGEKWLNYLGDKKDNKPRVPKDIPPTKTIFDNKKKAEEVAEFRKDPEMQAKVKKLIDTLPNHNKNKGDVK